MQHFLSTTMVLFFFTPGRNRSCPGSLKTVLFQRPGKKYRVLIHARFYPVLPEPRTYPGKKVWTKRCGTGRVLFQYPGNLPELPELPGLTPVLVRKRTANPVEVVATPVTEMLQCNMPRSSRSIFYVLCLLFGQYSTTTTYLAKNVVISRFCGKYLNE